ncbi:oligopeptidase A [Sideroxyarcus emersonii]|uniref:oligopeptidase A n=1 Tax=Sideroxyarcus emersonii TaxID=2764705 RepID=A0AAN1XC99_9PROT|nr:M3 family metallopeptidase [Sideroxyarcus emersonii]BCK88865.1 oligopeptidase A [Sideroxyarcus emersonii]
MNPLLDFSGLPRFAEIKPEHVTPAVDELLARNRALVEQLLAADVPPTWGNFVQPFEDANEHLTRAWGQVGHLNMVMNAPELREVYNANLPKVTQYYAELSQNLALYRKYKAIREGGGYVQLNAAQKKVIENELRDFRLGGAELPEEQKARFMAIQEELSALCSKFSDNLLDATNAYTCVVESEAEIAGIPPDERQVAAEAAQQAGRQGWLFTLKAPSYGPVMQYADNRALRERMYRAYTTRASEQLAEGAKADWDNTPLMSQILLLRGEEARMLGFANYAELSLASKMAETPAQVAEFLHELARRARPFAEKDLQELRAFAETNLGMKKMEAWDIGYASEKLRQQRYAFSEQEVKQYFPEDAVLAGLFGLVEALFGLKVRPSAAPVWHEAVRFFDIRDGQDVLVGQFYLDLYARASKRGGAWMDDAITRRRTARGIQTPVAYLNCNFAAPVGGRPALFTHDEVITLFHEFGHGLHHLLTQVEELGVSGISGVEWDAVELPSQFMENFCWEWDVLQGMTRHADSGEKLPRSLYDKMIAAKNFQSGLQMLRQIEFSLFDLRLHSDYDAAGKQSIQQMLDEVRAEVAVLIPPAFNRFQNSFSHIFAGGYAAGYYSYKWAEVLSADAYSLFEENGVLDAATGSHFRQEILAVGGSRDAMDSFIAFRGREPKIDALLRHNGLATE